MATPYQRYQMPSWTNKFDPRTFKVAPENSSWLGNTNSALWNMAADAQRGQNEQTAGYGQLAELIKQMSDPARLNQYFNVAGGNLSQRQGQSVGRAQSTAAAQAASRGLLNPSGYVSGAGSQTAAPYAQAFGNLEQGRAEALQALAKQAFDANYLLNRAKQGDQMAIKQLDLLNRELNAKISASEAGFEDYAGLGLKALAAYFGG